METIENLVWEMSLEEKVSLLAGADQWHTVPIDRLGIPSLKVTDGPIGARGVRPFGGPPSACFPAGVALAATWNTDLVERVGQALAQETQAKGAHILLAPTVNTHRSPLAGRNFECYSEDPHLTSRMAVAYINGLQSQGVGACIKHFVCNDSEFERRTISSEVGERALHEIYFPPFRAALREAKPWGVMSSYNRVNGTYCSSSHGLLHDILKEAWRFDGIVISDWYGTYNRDCAHGGLDLEMPGPARWMGEWLVDAVQDGEFPETLIDDKVRRLLRTIQKAGLFENPERRPERAVDRPEHRLLAREAAAEGIVLLKNTGCCLPLDPNSIQSIAVIGQNARWAPTHGGGSTRVAPHYVVSPLQGIIERFGDQVEINYQVGCTLHRQLPLIETDCLTTRAGRPGLDLTIFDNEDLSGEPVHAEVISRAHLGWFEDAPPHVTDSTFSLRLDGVFTAPEEGSYTFGLKTVGMARLLVDGKTIIDNWTSPTSSGMLVDIESSEKRAHTELVAGQSVELQLDYSSTGTSAAQSLRLGCLPPVSPHSIRDAAALAARSDVAIVFAGMSEEWESEGFDRPDMELPGKQVDLIQQVAVANENTIVVLNTGAPVTMPWLDRVPAVIQAWYLGQETGNAIADVLSGIVNPSGKLPTTFPKSIKDNPAYINYPGENGRVGYGEGIFVGYRYFDEKAIEPLFPFGYGLSYTTFAYRNLVMSATRYRASDVVQAQVEVENTGTRAGQELVQLYVRDVASSLRRPEKELKGFAKVLLQPGETKTVTFRLDQEDLSFYDPGRERWVAEDGVFELLVGGSSRDIHFQARFTFESEPEPTLWRYGKFHAGLTLQVLMADARARAVLEKHVGGLVYDPRAEAYLDVPLEEISEHIPFMVPPPILRQINEDLSAL